MSFPGYKEYKDSGIEWLGKVPKHWHVSPLKNVANLVNGFPFDSKLFDGSEGMPIIRIRDLDKWEDKGERVESAVVTSEDVLIGMDGDFNVGRWRGDSEALLNQRMCCVRGKDAMTTRLLEYALPRPLKAINDITFSTTVKHLSSRDVERTRVAIPPDPTELRDIVSFLDSETSKIDALVSEQRRLIELLKEKRQAIISHAVTKGLNPNAPMKPSGIQWLGDVPQHWKVVPIKHLCSLLKDGTHLPPPRVDDGIPLLSVRNLVEGAFVLRDDDSMISHESYNDLCRAFVPAAGDVLLAIVGATLGKTAVIPDGLGDFHIQRSVGIFRTHPNRLAGTFLHLVFQSSQFQSKLWELVGYSAQPGIYLGTLQNLRVPVPPEKEQDEIVELIAGRTDRLTELLAVAERAIELLQERRTALISAAVTGKIDVRKFANKEAVA